MNSSIKILLLTVIREYYRQNIGFLGLILFFAGSFLSSIEHLTLGKLAVHLPFILAIYSSIWAIYALKSLLFTLRLLENPVYSFLYNLSLLPKIKRFSALVFLQINLLSLSLFYSLFVAYLGVKEQQWYSFLAIISFDFLMIFGGVFIIDYKLKRQNFAQNTKFFRIFAFKFRTIYPLFFIRYLINKQPILLFLSKMGACLLLVGICKLYPTDDYDERLLALGGLFAAAINVIICTRLFEFENQYLQFIKNLPFTIPQRFFKYATILFFLLIPEFLMLFRYLPDGVSNIFMLENFAFIFSFNLLIISTLRLNILQEKLMVRMFYGGIFVFILIMFKIPILLIAFVNFAMSFIVFKNNFYRSETLI